LINKSFDAIDRDFLINDMVNNTSLTFNEAATGIDYLFKSISEYGFMIVASACFLFMSITTIFLFYRWYSKILGSIVDDSRQSQKEISETMKNLLLSTKQE